MIKNVTKLEVKIDGRAYELMCAPESPLGELYDALCSMRGYVIDRIKASQESNPAEGDNVSQQES